MDLGIITVSESDKDKYHMYVHIHTQTSGLHASISPTRLRVVLRPPRKLLPWRLFHVLLPNPLMTTRISPSKCPRTPCFICECVWGMASVGGWLTWVRPSPKSDAVSTIKTSFLLLVHFSLILEHRVMWEPRLACWWLFLPLLKMSSWRAQCLHIYQGPSLPQGHTSVSRHVPVSLTPAPVYLRTRLPRMQSSFWLACKFQVLSKTSFSVLPLKLRVWLDFFSFEISILALSHK